MNIFLLMGICCSMSSLVDLPRPPFDVFSNSVPQDFQSAISFEEITIIEEDPNVISANSTHISYGEWHGDRVYLKERSGAGDKLQYYKSVYDLYRSVGIPVSEYAFLYDEEYVVSKEIQGVGEVRPLKNEVGSLSFRQVCSQYPIDDFLTHYAYFLLFRGHDMGHRNMSYVSGRTPEFVYFDLEPIFSPFDPYYMYLKFIDLMDTLSVPSGLFFDVVQKRALSIACEALVELENISYSTSLEGDVCSMYIVCESFLRMFFDQGLVKFQITVDNEVIWDDPVSIAESILSESVDVRECYPSSINLFSHEVSWGFDFDELPLNEFDELLNEENRSTPYRFTLY